MNRTPVKSSAIRSIGHDAEKQILHVEFNSGQVFEYTGVTEEQHADLISATSIGKYYNENIVGKFPGRKYGN